MSRAIILVQARMSSQRLPGKVLRPLAGAPAIVRMMERVRASQEAERCLLVTSTHESDDPLVERCRADGIECFRGSLDDVLGRFRDACPVEFELVVRLTGDCPLIDPGLIDEHLRAFRASGPEIDYLSNAVERSFPDGLDVEVFTRASLERAAREATSAYDREHVTPWIIRHASRRALTRSIDLSQLRWTLDTEADFANIAAIYAALHPTRPRFTRFDVYRLLIEQPALLRVAGQEILAPEAAARWQDALRLALQETA